ncbi:MAG: TlpA disulfide reductase family protein [Thermoguttaceae bacterium]
MMRGILLTVVCLAASAAWPVMAEDRPAASKDRPSAKPSAEKAGDKSADKSDPFVVPEGTEKELAAYIRRIGPPPVHDQATMERKRKAILKAAEKILAGKPSDSDRELAVQAKTFLLDDPVTLGAFADELKKAGQPKHARFVRRFIVVRGLRLAGYQLQRETRSGTPSAELQKQVKSAVGDVVKYLEESPPVLADKNVALVAGQVAEMTGDDRLAIATYSAMAKALAASKEPQLAFQKKIFEGMARRLDLVGKTMKIEGKLIDGTPFDWSKYRGKVVLVDFWATWCGSCVASMPRLRKYYDAYHSKGFEIVGVSADHRLADVQSYAKEKKVPWPIVYNGDRPSPAFDYYGVRIIPTMILVDKDGKVLSLDADGPYLKQWLAKLLGPMPAAKKATPDKAHELDRGE